MAISKEARVETTMSKGHTHLYARRVANPQRASYTTKTNGHRHKIIRDGAGKALRFEREIGEDGTMHAHRIN
jgi:hypothetical protein